MALTGHWSGLTEEYLGTSNSWQRVHHLMLEASMWRIQV